MVYYEHNMNTNRSYHKQFIAYLHLHNQEDGLCIVPSHDLLIERQDNIIRFGITEAAAPLTLRNIYSVMHLVAQSSIRRDTKLVWAFSSVAIEVAELPALLDRWDETREPPLLSIIALDLGKHRHVTRGMAALVGYEIAATFNESVHSHDAARNLARLARYAIMNSGLVVDAKYESVDGRLLNLDWCDHASSPAMVTILL
jgi:hypothetical protein